MNLLPCTFVLPVQSPIADQYQRPLFESMASAGIFDQDLLIVDRSKKKPNGKVVIASLNGEFTLKRLAQTRESFELQPENPDYPSIPISVDDDFQIWGVVRHVIHKV